MTCTTAVVSDLFFVRWLAPESTDLTKVLDQVQTTSKNLGRPLSAIIAVVPTGTTMPGGDFRKEAAEQMKILNRHVDLNLLVIEGEGFKNAAMRGMAMAIYMLAGERNAFIHANVEEALGRLSSKGKLKGDSGNILRQARSMGIIK